MSACSAEWNERLSAFLDDEASVTERAAVESHTNSCADCRAILDAYVGIRQRVRASESAPSENTSPLASERIQAAVLAAATNERSQQRRRRVGVSVRVAAAIAAALVLVVGAFAVIRPPSLDPRLMLELEGQHMRAFTHGRPCDFESPDPQLVSDWIANQSDRRIDVPMLPGAELVGARRCKLSGRPAFALVYQVDGRGLTVFVPGDGTDAADAAISFADGGARCTTGTLGERICAASGASRTALAVGNDDHLVLLASTAAVDG